MENEAIIKDRTVRPEPEKCEKIEKTTVNTVSPDERIRRARPENPFHEVDIK